MGTNNVVSLTQRRAAKLAAEISSPFVWLDPLEDETVDEFIERVGAAISDLISDTRRESPKNEPTGTAKIATIRR